MKRPLLIISICLLSVLIYGCSASTNTSEEKETKEPTESNSVVKTYGQLAVSGNKIVNQNGNAIQLRGMSLFWSQWMGKYYTTEVVDWLTTDWKSTVIRASMGVEDDGGYIDNPSNEKQKIFSIIDAAINNGIYVIVDWHSHHAEDYTEEAKQFFTEVAQKYGDKPNIIYEIYNEPLENVSWTATLKPYHEAVIAAIRTHDPDNIVICGTPSWSQRVDEVIGNTIGDDNVAYALHYYAASHKQYLRDLAQQALDNDIALFVTEFGVTEYTGDGFVDVVESNTWWQFLDQNKISWCNWSIADKEENAAALLPGASPNGGWTDSDLSQSGKMVRAEIRSKNPKFD